MDDAELRRRLWEGFAALQTLLGGSARNGLGAAQGRAASRAIVPSAPDSPALNAAVALDPEVAPDALTELEVTYGDAGVRRWAVWIDGARARTSPTEFRNAGPGDRVRVARAWAPTIDAARPRPDAPPTPARTPACGPSGASTTSPTATSTRGWSER